MSFQRTDLLSEVFRFSFLSAIHVNKDGCCYGDKRNNNTDHRDCDDILAVCRVCRHKLPPDGGGRGVRDSLFGTRGHRDDVFLAGFEVVELDFSTVSLEGKVSLIVQTIVAVNSEVDSFPVDRFVDNLE